MARIELTHGLYAESAQQPQAEAVPPLEVERKEAERQYSITAFNYPEAPIGSRDWALYWAGWLARSTTFKAPQQAEAVPPGYVLVPVDVLKAAAESLGNFVSDHGWGDADMRAMDNLDAALAAAPKGQP